MSNGPMDLTPMPSALLARRLRSRLWCQKQVGAGHRGRSAKKISPIMNRNYLLKILLAVVMLGSVASPAMAGVLMEVTLDSVVPVEYTSANPGLELQWQYTIKNLSTPPGDVNNMIEFSLTAGTNNGVFAIEKFYGYEGFVGNINTYLNATSSGFTGYLPPAIMFPGDNQVQLFLYTPVEGMGARKGRANAVSEGSFSGGPTFNEVEVKVPCEKGEEGDLGVRLEEAGGGKYLVKWRSVEWREYVLEGSESLEEGSWEEEGGWEAGTGGEMSREVEVEAGKSRKFWRVKRRDQ